MSTSPFHSGCGRLLQLVVIVGKLQPQKMSYSLEVRVTLSVTYRAEQKDALPTNSMFSIRGLFCTKDKWSSEQKLKCRHSGKERHKTSKAGRSSALPQGPKLFRTEARLQIAKEAQTKQGWQIICFAPGTKALQKSRLSSDSKGGTNKARPTDHLFCPRDKSSSEESLVFR